MYRLSDECPTDIGLVGKLGRGLVFSALSLAVVESAEKENMQLFAAGMIESRASSLKVILIKVIFEL